MRSTASQLTVLLFTLLSGSGLSAHDKPRATETAYHSQAGWLTPPKGLAYIGSAHGDIAVSRAGTVYISVLGGEKSGIQIYDADGAYLGNVAGAPSDIHAFLIRQEDDGQEYIYAVQLEAERVVKMRLNGEKVIDIALPGRIPAQFHNAAATLPKGVDTRALKLSGIAVASRGDIYVVDGYGRDYIHQLNAKGEYLRSFGGREAPWNFQNCHKIAIDPRYQPERLLCADRANGRLVHMTLSGERIGLFAEGLRRPSAMAFRGDQIAVAEISGRVSLWDSAGQQLGTLGTNDNRELTDHRRTPPEKWIEGVFNSPHGIAFDAQGDLYITEYNRWGRILKFTREAIAPPAP